jgi:hypothetical protein
MESLTLTQTRRVDKLMPIIIYGREFWDGVINLQKLVERGMISPGDLNLFHFANTPEEAMAYLQQRLSFEIPDVR